MSSAQSELKFPLEERFLARVRLNSNRFEDWRATAQREIDSILGNQRSWYYRPNDLKQVYRLVYEQDAIRGFLKSRDNSGRKDLLSLAHLEFTLEDLIAGYHCSSTADQRAVYAQLYGETWLDGAILRSVEGAHARDPFHFIGLKWLAFASPAQGIMTNRDYVFFEFSGTTQDANGRRVLFVYQKSFLLNSDELSEPDKGCSRGDFYQISLFRMEGGGVLLHSISQFEAQLDAPLWFDTRAITESFDSIKNFVGLVDARAVATAGMIKHANKATKSGADSKACVTCQKKFGMMRSRHGCCSCGRSMCKHCVIKLSFFNDEAFFSSVPTVLCENFCQSCVKHARSQRQLEAVTASLTKANISAAVLTSSSHTAYLASPYNSSSRHQLRSSIEKQVGMAHSDSGSEAGGSSQSLASHSQLFNRLRADSPASASYASSSGTARSPYNSSASFEQLNASIRQQEELLLVIQQERAKMQARQPPPVTLHTPYAAVSAASVSSVFTEDDSGDRFQELS